MSVATKTDIVRSARILLVALSGTTLQPDVQRRVVALHDSLDALDREDEQWRVEFYGRWGQRPPVVYPWSKALDDQDILDAALLVDVFDDEYGTCYALGHLRAEVMIAAVDKYMAVCGVDPEDYGYYMAEEVKHVWYRQDPHDEERMHLVESTAYGATAYTKVDARWD